MGQDVDNPLTGGEVLHQIRHQGGPVGVAQNNVRIGQGLGLFRKRLGHTAGEDNDSVGVLPAGPVQGLADFVVAGGGDRAGVHQDNVGLLGRIAGGDARRCQAGQHILGLILVDFAAKGDGVYFHSKVCFLSLKIRFSMGKSVRTESFFR